MNPVGHFCTITRHKLLVMKYCFQVGLYRQGILHDLSKYSLAEFLVGCRYYQGNRSPNNAEREENGYSSAWLHHKGRNKHHYEYWMDYSVNLNEGIVGMKMPVKYVVEMFLDRVSACRNYRKENYTDRQPLEYFLKGKDRAIIHEDTSRLLEYLLRRLARDGEAATLRYIRRELLGRGRGRVFTPMPDNPLAGMKRQEKLAVRTSSRGSQLAVNRHRCNSRPHCSNWGKIWRGRALVTKR